MQAQIEDTITSLTQIPFVEGGRDDKGCDCWGLVVVFYKNIFNINLPFYGNVFYENEKNYDTTCDEIENIKNTDALFKQIEKPEFGDIIMLRVMGRPLHIGVVLDNKKMIHTNTKSGVVIEKFTGDKWKSRIMGYYTVVTQ